MSLRAATTEAVSVVVNALVSGFGYTVDCAVASTVAHDSHQMIVVGTNRDDMALAANRLGEVGGGARLRRTMDTSRAPAARLNRKHATQIQLGELP